MIHYTWENPQQLSNVRLKKPKGKIDYENVREIIKFIKGMIQKEHDRGVKKHLAIAGLELNKILLK